MEKSELLSHYDVIIKDLEEELKRLNRHAAWFEQDRLRGFPLPAQSQREWEWVKSIRDEFSNAYQLLIRRKENISRAK